MCFPFFIKINCFPVLSNLFKTNWLKWKLDKKGSENGLAFENGSILKTIDIILEENWFGDKLKLG